MDPLPTTPPENEADWFAALARLARFLRGPDGCPWDQEQTAKSFGKYAREEADEYVEALESNNPDHMAEEWGDTFFVLMASAAAAEAEGLFTIPQAMAKAHEKMVRRHDHVFGNSKAATPEEAIDAWNRMKKGEKAD